MLFGMPGTAGGARQAGAPPPGPFDFLQHIMNPGNAQHGDFVFNQEALDRIVTQLMEQHQGGNAPPPASEEAIHSLPTKKVDESMIGDDGKAECSICMDDVSLGDEVTVLPCTHWFHRECVTHWLKEHDTCPHCRKPISNSQQPNQQSQPSRPGVRRSSSVATPRPVASEGNSRAPTAPPDSPTAIRQARQAFYGRQEAERPQTPRTSSTPTASRHGSRGGSGGSGGGSGTGVTGWIRDHMPSLG